MFESSTARNLPTLPLSHHRTQAMDAPMWHLQGEQSQSQTKSRPRGALACGARVVALRRPRWPACSPAARSHAQRAVSVPRSGAAAARLRVVAVIEALQVGCANRGPCGHRRCVGTGAAWARPSPLLSDAPDSLLRLTRRQDASSALLGLRGGAASGGAVRARIYVVRCRLGLLTLDRSLLYALHVCYYYTTLEQTDSVRRSRSVD